MGHSNRTTKWKPRPQDPKLFTALFNILHWNCLNGNYTATARALGVSIKTARKWEEHPPQRYWETVIVREAIRSLHQYFSASKNVHKRKRAVSILMALRDAKIDNIAENMEVNTAQHSGSMMHVISVIAHTPTREMGSDELFLAANSGGYNKRTLRQAISNIGLPRETIGFGADKVTYYRIPKPGDLDT